MLSLRGTTLVVGLGKSGLSAARALMALDAAVTVADSRFDPPGLADLRAEFPTVPLQLGEFDPALLAKAARLLVSPG
ncbi:MAG: UDP-N-acetylmuramoyl-L-alanine--D-glutamate ligase, partial [Candidatus Competibacter sp.]